MWPIKAACPCGPLTCVFPHVVFQISFLYDTSCHVRQVNASRAELHTGPVAQNPWPHLDIANLILLGPTHRLLKYPTELGDVRNSPIKVILEDGCLSGITFRHLHVAKGPFVFITVYIICPNFQFRMIYNHWMGSLGFKDSTWWVFVHSKWKRLCLWLYDRWSPQSKFDQSPTHSNLLNLTPIT